MYEPLSDVSPDAVVAAGAVSSAAVRHGIRQRSQVCSLCAEEMIRNVNTVKSA